MSIFAWVKLAGTGGNCVVIGDSDATNTEHWSLRLMSDGTVRLTWATGAGGAAIYGTDSAVINDTNLHSILVTQTGSSAPIFYIDGSLVASSLIFGSAANPKPTAQSTAIGEYGGYTGGLQWMNGALRLVCLWDAVKTSGNATTLHNGGTPGSFNGTSFVFSVNNTLACAQGSYTLTGQALALKKSMHVLMAQGSYALTGFALAFIRGRTMVLAQGSYFLTGFSLAFTKAMHISLAQGSYVLTGFAMATQRAAHMTMETGYYVLTGFAAITKHAWSYISKAVTNFSSPNKHSTNWNQSNKNNSNWTSPPES